MEKTERSTFWAVSTYVLTCGLAFPAVAGAAGWGLAYYLELGDVRALAVMLGFQGLGYVGGMFHALAYIRKEAEIENPMGCVTPSVIAFLVLAAVGIWANVTNLPSSADPSFRNTALVAVGVFYAVIFLAFLRVTRHGFHIIEKQSRSPTRVP